MSDAGKTLLEDAILLDLCILIFFKISSLFAYLGFSDVSSQNMG
jgi:hypothetical protein